MQIDQTVVICSAYVLFKTLNFRQPCFCSVSVCHSVIQEAKLSRYTMYRQGRVIFVVTKSDHKYMNIAL